MSFLRRRNSAPGEQCQEVPAEHRLRGSFGGKGERGWHVGRPSALWRVRDRGCGARVQTGHAAMSKKSFAVTFPSVASMIFSITEGSGTRPSLT
jgi:hypothetical protein